MTKDFLGGLMLEWPLLVLESSSINTLDLNNGTSGNLLQILKNLELGPHILQEPVIVIVTIPSIILIHILYKRAFPFLLLSPQETYNLIRLDVL